MVVETVWQPFDENDFNFCDADNEYNDDFEGDDDCCNGKKRNYKKNGFIWEKWPKRVDPATHPCNFIDLDLGLGIWDF